jgi:hypothetical protein
MHFIQIVEMFLLAWLVAGVATAVTGLIWVWRISSKMLKEEQIQEASPSTYGRRGGAVCRRRKRCTLERFPQASMSHQRRIPLRLVSRKSQLQFSPAHCPIRSSLPEVSRSTAKRVTLQSARSKARRFPSQTKSKRFPTWRRLVLVRACLNSEFNLARARGWGLPPRARAEKTS